MASSSASNYLHQKWLDHLLKNTVYTAPTSLWVALFTTAPALNGSGGVEVSTSGTAYGRVEITSTGSSWTGPSGANQEYSNIADIIFNVPTANWGTLTAIGIYDASSAGNLMYVAPLTTPKTVSNGDGAPRFLAGEIRIGRAVC